MKSSLTPYFSNFLAQDLKDHFANGANVYIGIGRSLQFGSSVSNVEDVVFTTVNSNEVHRDLVGLKRIQPSDMQVVVPRRDWVTGFHYDQYEDESDNFDYIDIANVGTVNSNANVVITGTANIFSTNVVAGSGTTFTDYLFPGDKISIDSQLKEILIVTNNDHLIVNTAFSTTKTAQTITLVANSKRLVANSSDFNLRSVGDIVRINTDDREIVSILSGKVVSLNANVTYSNSNVIMHTVSNTYPYTANNFYIRNSKDQVFKCLFDNNDATSTVEPTIDIDGQLPESPFIQTGDGYKWKYLYTIPAGLKQKFFNLKWMPVISDQAVVAGSVDGAIDVIEILWGGSGHIGGGNSNTARILQVTGTDGANANLVARVSNGVITGVTILNGGNNYTLGSVTVDDSARLGTQTLTGTVNVTGITVSANASNTATFVGQVYTNDIVTVNNESRNVVTVTSNQLTVNSAFANPANTQFAVITRSNAQFNIQFSPPGGHGSDPQRELGARTLMISTELVGNENSTIPVSEPTQVFDFNQVSIILNPTYQFANGVTYLANSDNLRATTRLLVGDPGVSNFVQDETVFMGTSLETANAVANVAHWSPDNNYLYINNISGRFLEQETVTGVSSGISTAILEISNSEIKPFSGTLFYIENRKNIVRLSDQIDQIKIILSF
jgi:hypothetical protein